MALTPGTRLGAYQVTAYIGEGGMGEVYRATDTVLGRSVAIKILPESFASDPERLARFEQEAKTLATLNHPNIAQIYGFERANEVPALIMELVEGPTLAERLTAGVMPLPDALEVAKQIADGLEAAHEKGIVHRDLKPANVKITPQGAVKILDFGLAAMTRSAPTDVSATQSPTLMLATSAGVIMGTAAYMSPEQASGKPVDKRADIWAFGVVLWEMLTGRRLFEGETASHTMAFVLTKEPDWAVLPATTPEPIGRLLRRCLEKAPRRRLADIADARFDIDAVAQRIESGEVVEPATPAATHSQANRGALHGVFGLVAGIALTAIAAYGWVRFSPRPDSDVVRFTIGAPAGQAIQVSTFDRDVVISPDGTKIVYVATEGGGRRRLMVRPLDRLAAVPIHEISSAVIAVSLFVSPDSRWVGFFEGGELKKIPITGGGTAIPLCKVDGNPRGASWGPDNTIVFATDGGRFGLRRVSAAGGDPQALTHPDRNAGERDHLFPSVLPDGQSALFVITTADANRSRVGVVDFAVGKYTTVIRDGSHATYLPSGHLLYASAGTLFAVAFDSKRRASIGDPVPALDQLMTVATGAANFDVASNGTMVFIPGGANQTAKRLLVWVDRQGREQPINAEARAYVSPRLSPDDTRIAVDIRDQQEDIWIVELARQTLTPLTNDPLDDQRPVWTRDGRIVFNSSRSGAPGVYWQSADGTGTAEQLTYSDSSERGDRSASVTSMTPDGTGVVVDGQTAKGSRIALLPLREAAGTRRTLAPLVEGVINLRNGEVSPDGRWIAYQSNESNQPEIYVRPFPDVNGGSWRISPAGGIKPAWARNSRELFYVDASDALVSVSIQASGSTLIRGNPTKVFDAGRYLVRSAYNARTYDVSNDGERFLMVKDTSIGESGAPTGPTTITVVTNWLADLERLVPGR